MNAPHPILSLQSVTKAFAGLVVLDNLSIDVKPGASSALIGPSGCGKSTLLRLMNGLLTPDSGRVLFDGEALSDDKIGPVRQRIGYVIQDGGLFPHLSAAGNVTLMADYLGWNSDRQRERISELAEMVKLDDELLQRFPTQLSGGQRQRVALMRALMLDPELLLLDEPLGALDPIIRYDLQTDLRALFRELGKTVVIVSHDLTEAGWFGDSVILLDQGRIVQQGIMDELISSPASPFVERFVQAQRGHGAAL